jgi:ubiquinone/menaquinone biosynthesis C-methylase UbiE
VSADFFVNMAVGYRGAKALMVAVRKGVFDVLESKPRPAADVARDMGWNATATGQLLGALGALGVVHEDRGRFANTELGARHLVRGRPEYLGHALHFADMLWDSWSHLDDSLRTGQPRRPLQALLESEDRTFVEQYVRGMQGLARGPARHVVRIVGPRPGCNLLDVGCGPGAYSVAFLEAHPQMRTTLLDLAPTLAVARDVIGDSPLAARMRFREGNYLADAYGGEYDLVLMSHVTHDESPENVAHMFASANAAMVPGGRILVHDWVVDESGCAPPFAALFSLHVMLYTSGGRVYRRSEYADLLERAGFEDVQFDTVPAAASNPTTLVSARKPF